MTEEARQAAAWLAKKAESGDLMPNCQLGKVTKTSCAKRIAKARKQLGGQWNSATLAPREQMKMCALCVMDRELERLKSEGKIDE